MPGSFAMAVPPCVVPPDRSRFARRPLILTLLIIAGVVALLGAYEVWFRTRDQNLKRAGESLLRSISVAPTLQPLGKEYFSGSSWSMDYNPHWVYDYQLNADRQSAFATVKQAFVDVCGPNTPDAPYRVTADERSQTYVSSANCKGHMVHYALNPDGISATITVNL
jgi:hypothetical protein